MATRLDSRLTRLKARKSDSKLGWVYKNDLMEKAEARSDTSAKAKEYIVASMEPVDQNYTKNTFEECGRIEKQILEACETANISISLRHQGSVTTDTHVKIHSDIDLLVINEEFISIKSPLQPKIPYGGDPLSELKDLRALIEDRLASSFPSAKVDCSGAKAVQITGGSLRRKIDVIPANWLDTEEFRINEDESYRGVKVLDLSPPAKRITNFPFMHNHEINKYDRLTLGGLKRLIRFVKSVRYDADRDPGVSSYDIAALCLSMPQQRFLAYINDDLGLSNEFLQYSDSLCNNVSSRSSLEVPNKTRLLFGHDGLDVQCLKDLNEELRSVLQDARCPKGLI